MAEVTEYGLVRLLTTDWTGKKSELDITKQEALDLAIQLVNVLDLEVKPRDTQGSSQTTREPDAWINSEAYLSFKFHNPGDTAYLSKHPTTAPAHFTIPVWIGREP